MRRPSVPELHVAARRALRVRCNQIPKTQRLADSLHRHGDTASQATTHRSPTHSQGQKLHGSGRHQRDTRPAPSRIHLSATWLAAKCTTRRRSARACRRCCQAPAQPRSSAARARAPGGRRPRRRPPGRPLRQGRAAASSGSWAGCQRPPSRPLFARGAAGSDRSRAHPAWGPPRRCSGH
jgi:hypothetical protein